MREIFSELKPALILLTGLTLLTGAAYPALVTGVAQTVFPEQANGSLLHDGDRITGSTLIGQQFSDPKDFWGRPSATAPMPYNGGASGGSNLGPTNPAQADAVQARIEALKASNPTQQAGIPVDLVTASGSGLDPHISPAAAHWQVPRVAAARHLPDAKVRALVERYTEDRQFGVLGEPRVNVLLLNRALASLPP